MGRNTVVTKIIIEYLEKYGNTIPSHTLAKIIHRDNPLDFKDSEAARDCIRYYRGKHGATTADRLSTNKYLKKDSSLTPFQLPKPISKDYEPVIIHSSYNNIGVISDVHIPNHRNDAIELALNFFLKEDINCLVINGDLLDNTPFTRHEGKRPSADEVREWFDMTEYFLECLREYFPKAKIYWTEGNHDYWYKRWMHSHAWQLDNDPYFSLQERLHLSLYEIEFVPQTTYLMAGKLAICHGHHLIKGIIAPVNAARGLILKAKVPVLIGHVHVSSEHTETDMHGNITTCWSSGCLCTLTPEYQPMGGKANQGFSHVKVFDAGEFNLRNYRIHKGKLY